MKDIIGKKDILFITLDTLRYDVAQRMHLEGKTPNISARLPSEGWEKRHSPGNFTYAAHQAFFAGFLPTPAKPGKHKRLFAASFSGSETTGEETFVYQEATFIEGLANRGYHTMCIGGVGFFNQQTAIGQILPGYFKEAHWSRELGVTDPCSTAHQFKLAAKRLQVLPQDQRLMLFINVSALHQPNYHHLPMAQWPEDKKDTIESHAAALVYVDSCFPILFEALQRRADCFCIVCGDHGTAYGEEGYYGHRISLDVVTTVPFTTFELPQKGQ